MQSVFVSVLMTCYNREAFISEAIESVLTSSHKNFELIIVDDGSNDKSVEIAKSYARKDERIIIKVNDTNLGDYANRNKAASFAKGKYLKYVDSDDKIYDWTLQYCVDEMEKFPEAAFGIRHYNNIRENFLMSKVTVYKNFFEATILNVGPSGTIIKREAFKKAGGYDAIYGPASDMFFNLKMANSFPIVLLKKDFFFYRKHDGQELNNRYSYLQYNYKYLVDAFKMQNFPLNQQQKKYLLNRQGYWYVKDFFVYLKSKGNLLRAFKAARHSGLGISGFIKGFYHLVFIKLKLKKDF